MAGYEDESFEWLGCPLVLMQVRDDSVRLDNWSRYVERELGLCVRKRALFWAGASTGDRSAE